MKGWKNRLTEASVLVAFLGLAFVIIGVILWYLELAPAAESLHQAFFELFMHVLFGGVILILGIHIERSDLLPEEKFAAIMWCYGGFTLMFALSVWGHLGSILNGELTVTFASDFVIYTSIGGAFGVVSGVNWGRAEKNRRLVRRNEEQNETLALLTRLVSHDIRNDMGVIKGYADILVEHVNEDGMSYLETIQERIDETVQLLKDTSALVKSIDHEREFEPIDLSTILEREVATLGENNPELTLETDISDGLRVKADSLLQQLFSNLLQNAVFHNDAEDLTIEVTAQQAGENVEVVVSDDGKGIPPDLGESCFELGEKGTASEGDGIGLYLVSRLADIYEGSVELTESPAGGARFRVTFSNFSS